MYQITGTIHRIFDTAQMTESFCKRDVVITYTDNNYTKFLALQFTQNRCANLDDYSVGQQVIISFNLESKEYQGKYFTNATAWRIVPVSTQAQNPSAASAPVNAVPFTPTSYTPAPDSTDDLPF